MSLPFHSRNFDVNYYGIDICGLSNKGYQRQQNGSHFSSNPLEGYFLMNTTKGWFPISSKPLFLLKIKAGNNLIEALNVPTFSKTQCANKTQYAATEMMNGLNTFFTMDQSMTDIFS